MTNIFVSILGVYQNVMDKHHYKLVQIGFETLIDRIHRGYGSIGQAKEHHHEFVMTIFGFKWEFGDVFKVMSRLLLLNCQVKFEKDFCFL